MKPKRYKVQCCACKAVFNNDYKSQHEKTIHNGNRVSVQDVGAPKNPFDALTRKRKKTVDVSMEMENQESSPTNREKINMPMPLPCTTDMLDLNKNSEEIKDFPSPIDKCRSTDKYLDVIGGDNKLLTPCNLDSLKESEFLHETTNFKILESENENKSNWVSFMGKFSFIIEKLTESKNIFSRYNKSEIVNEKLAITEIINTISSVKETCDIVLEDGYRVLTKLSNQFEFSIEDSESSSEIINHDPGLRPAVLNENQKTYLIQLGPHQPKLAYFPSDGKNRFNPNWYTEFEYLEYSTAMHAVFCFVCCLFPVGVGREKREDAWTSTGVKTWGKMKSCGKDKLGKLQQHFSSQAHKSALYDYCNFLVKNKHIDVLIDKSKRQVLIEEEKIQLHNREVIKILMDTCKTLGKQGLAFRESNTGDLNKGNFFEVMQLISRYNPTIKCWFENKNLRPYHVTYMSPQSQNEMIDLIASEIRQVIISEIGNSLCFAVMADTTPDLSHKDIMSIVIRTVSNEGKIRERLVKTIECSDKTGKGIAELILQCLNELEVDYNKLAFQSYDFAHNMSGKFKGVQKHVSEIVGRSVPYIPCQDHRTNTALEHACNISILIRDLFDILEKLYVFFTSSPKRFKHFQSNVIQIDNAVQLKNLSKTRWTARAESVNALTKSFEVIMELLENISQEKTLDSSTRTQAFGLYKKMKNFDFIASFFFMKNILGKIKILTEILEMPDFNVIDSIAVIKSTAQTLQTISDDSTGMNDLIKSSIVFAEKMGIDAKADFQKHHRKRVPPKRIDENNSTAADIDLFMFYRKEFKEILDTLIMGLNDNVSYIQANIAPIHSIFKLPFSKKNLSIDNLEKVINMFPPGSEKPDVHDLQSQMEIIFDLCSNHDVNSLNELFAQVKKFKDHLGQAYKLCILTFTAAYGVASNERSFSQLKIIKNALRTTMTDDRLDSLMLLKCENEIGNFIKLDNIITRWASLKTRRITLK